MPANLTGSTIASTYSQLLHVNGGPTATEKPVYSATGVATALKVGTVSAAVGNIRLSGNTVSALTGNLTLGPNIAFDNASNARTALGLGTMAVQNANNVALTGGTISNITDLAIADGGTGASTEVGARTNLGLGTMAVQNANNVALTGGTISNAAFIGGTISNTTFTGTLTGMTLVESATLATGSTTAGVNLDGSTLAADGTDTDIDINITPKGTGEVNVTNINVLSGKVPFGVITSRAYASFSDITDQTGSVTAATPVKFGTPEVAGSGITMASDGVNMTRLTFAAAGTYMVAPSLQLENSASSDHDVTIWFALNGTNIARSATRVTVPKVGDGGAAFFQIVFYVTVTAGQYVQVMWLPEDVAATIGYTAANSITPAIPSAIVVAERIA